MAKRIVQTPGVGRDGAIVRPKWPKSSKGWKTGKSLRGPRNFRPFMGGAMGGVLPTPTPAPVDCTLVNIPVDFTTGWVETDPNNLLTVIDADSVHADKIGANTYAAATFSRDYGAGFFDDRTRLRLAVTADNGGGFGLLTYVALSDNLTPLTVPNNNIDFTIFLNSLDGFTTADLNFSLNQYSLGALTSAPQVDFFNIAQPYTVYVELEINLVDDLIYIRFFSDPGFSTQINSSQLALVEATWSMRYLIVNSTYFTHDTNYQGIIDVDNFELAQCA